MWGAVTNTVYNGMPTSLGLVQTQLHCLGRGSMADKPRTSQCPSVSVADIIDCTTSPAIYLNNVTWVGSGTRKIQSWIRNKSIIPDPQHWINPCNGSEQCTTWIELRTRSDNWFVPYENRIDDKKEKTRQQNVAPGFGFSSNNTDPHH